MPRNRPGAKASRVVLGHPRDVQLVTLWAKKGKNSCAIGLDLSTQFWRVLSGGWGGAIVLGSLQLRGLRQFNPWWRVRDSNPGHKDYDSSALTD